MSYGMSAHDYLKRAESCLQQNDPRHLFYAAFELRCAVEARMQQYLECWDHVSKKQKQGWEINRLGSATERAFKTGDRVMRWRVEDEHTGETLVVLYYTPVTKKLQSNAKRLGDYSMLQRSTIPRPTSGGRNSGIYWTRWYANCGLQRQARYWGQLSRRATTSIWPLTFHPGPTLTGFIGRVS